MAQSQFLPYPNDAVNGTDLSDTEGGNRVQKYHRLKESDIDLATHSGPLFLGLFTLLLTG